MSELKFTDQNFDSEVMKSEIPVLIDFFASWCGPCQIQGPIVEELAQEYKDKIKIGSMDVDENPQVSGNYQIFSIPTIIIFNKGQIVEKMIGLQTKPAIKEKLDKLL